MYANYHTHTFRCNHATGSEEEYILKALENGIKIFGFSDHVPFLFPGDYQTSWKVQVEDADEYISTLKQLKEKYKDKIKIYIGFEMEYYPEHFDNMLNYVKGIGAQYLILGQHFICGEGPGNVHSSQEGHNEEDLVLYTDRLIEAMKTNKFTYIAHPDMLNFSGDESIYIREAKRLCVASKMFDIPLEYNLLGVYDDRHYPNEKFWKIASEIGCKVIFGFDAHSVERAYDEKSIVKAKAAVEKLGLNLIDETPIKPL